MGDTSIEWTGKTWNPVTGCDKVSPGCTHCYALTLARRLKAMGQSKYQRDGANLLTSGPGFGVTLHPDVLEEPLHWHKPGRVFVNSMSDLFHPEVPDEFIGRVFAVMAQTPEQTYQVLTKRPERMLACRQWDPQDLASYPLPNVWLGVSVENQRWTSRLEVLAKVPAAVRFLSCEPLLGSLNLDLTDMHWVIIGGESGPGARPCRIEWVRDIVRQCREASVPVFVKQLGSHWASQYCYVNRQRLLLGSNRFSAKGGNLSEWPPDLRIREFPK